MEKTLNIRCKSSSKSRYTQSDIKISKNKSGNSCDGALLKENMILKNKVRVLETILSDKRETRTSLKTQSTRFQNPDKEDSEKQVFTNRLKETVNLLQKEVKKLKKENFSLKEEITKLVKKSNESFTVSLVYRACLCNFIDIEELWYIVNPNGMESITVKEFLRGIRGIGLEIKEKKAQKMFLRVTQGEEQVCKRQFLFQMESLRPSLCARLDEVVEAAKRVQEVAKFKGINLEKVIEERLERSQLSLKYTLDVLKENVSEVNEELEVVVRGVFGSFLVLDSLEVKRVLNKFFAV